MVPRYKVTMVMMMSMITSRLSPKSLLQGYKVTMLIMITRMITSRLPWEPLARLRWWSMIDDDYTKAILRTPSKAESFPIRLLLAYAPSLLIRSASKKSFILWIASNEPNSGCQCFLIFLLVQWWEVFFSSTPAGKHFLRFAFIPTVARVAC